MAEDDGLAEEVDLCLQHGQVEQAWSVLRDRLGSTASLEDVVLSGGTAIEAADRLAEATFHYRLGLAGVPPWTSHPRYLPIAVGSTRRPFTRRRRTRKGGGSNHQVIR